MSYQTQNELEHFVFEEAVVQDFRPSPGGFTLLLDNVRILPENSTNRDIRTMRCNEMTLKIEGGTIRGLFEEAYRLYDADFHLVQELPERQCPPEEWEKLLKMLSLIMEVSTKVTRLLVVTTKTTKVKLKMLNSSTT